MSILRTFNFSKSVIAGGASPPAPESTPMILVWDADIDSTATLPLVSGGAYFSYVGTTDVTVDWGDGTVESFNTPAHRTHTYSTGGEKTITISGTLTHYGDVDYDLFSAMAAIVRVESFGSGMGLVNLNSAFHDTVNLTSLPSTLPPGITDLSWILNGSNYNGTEIKTWDVSSVVDFFGTLGYMPNFNQDLGSWDVSSAQIMNDMFAGMGAYNDGQIPFSGPPIGYIGIGTWNTSNVTSTNYMFGDCTQLGRYDTVNLSGWDMSSVTDMDYMFYGCQYFNSWLGDWNISNVTSLNAVFFGCTDFGKVTFPTPVSPSITPTTLNIVSNWNTSNVTNMVQLFNNCTNFEGDLSTWDTSNVQYMSSMFREADAFNSDISGWDTSSVLSSGMSNMFYGAQTFNQDLSGWCVSNITSLPSGFYTNTTAWNKTNRVPVWGTCPP